MCTLFKQVFGVVCTLEAWMSKCKSEYVEQKQMHNSNLSLTLEPLYSLARRIITSKHSNRQVN